MNTPFNLAQLELSFFVALIGMTYLCDLLFIAQFL